MIGAQQPARQKHHGDRQHAPARRAEQRSFEASSTHILALRTVHLLDEPGVSAFGLYSQRKELERLAQALERRA